jgi:transposase
MLASKGQHTSSLFLLRSAKLIWVPIKGKQEPWNVYQLYLFCTLDTRLLTAEGTELVKQEVAAGTDKKLVTMRVKLDRTDAQDNYIKRLQSTLDKLDRPFDRPSKSVYQGQSNIMVAVSMGLQSPVTAIAIDITTQKTLAYRNTKQLLGDNYRLINRQRNLQTQQRHSSHKAQKQGLSHQFSNSELGEHLDRLFAKAIVELAQTHRANSIALPKLDQIRLSIQSEIDTMAQQKIPDYLEGQKKYAKQVRINLHNWSYNRLSESIFHKAAQAGIAIEYGNQLARASPNERARGIALSAYAKRTI